MSQGNLNKIIENSNGGRVYVPDSPIKQIEKLLINKQGYESHPLALSLSNPQHLFGTRELKSASYTYLRDIKLLMGQTTLHIKENKKNEGNIEAAITLYGGIDYTERSRKGYTLFIPSSSFSMSMLLNNGIVSAFLFDIGSGLALLDNWYPQKELGKTHPKDILRVSREIDPILMETFDDKPEIVEQIKQQESWQVLPHLVMLAVEAYKSI